ncbi:MAG: RnfABCDGE type electron transport complex subunit D [Treponema sp.]
MKIAKHKDFSKIAPFIYTSVSVRSIHLSYLLLLLPQVLLLFLYHDIYAVLNIFASTTATLTCQSIVYAIEKTTFKIPFEAFLQGLLIGLFMPTNIGFVFVFILSFLGFALTKVIFGKSGNWVHSIMIVLIIAYISCPELFFFNASNLENIENPLPALSFDSYLTSFLNSYILNELGITLPEGYLSLFWNSSCLIPACRYNLLTVLSSIILLSLKVRDYTISVLFIILYEVFVYCFSAIFFQGDVLSSLMTGGLLFIVFFALAEPNAFPKTLVFKIISSLFLAIVSFLLSGGKATFITVAFATLLLNILTPYIEKLEKMLHIKKAIKRTATT